jgi:hypothetical protein
MVEPFFSEPFINLAILGMEEIYYKKTKGQK